MTEQQSTRESAQESAGGGGTAVPGAGNGGAEQILKPDEINALLHGVEEGQAGGAAQPGAGGEVRPYDFATPERVVRRRTTALELINERFINLFRVGMFHLLRRTPEVSVAVELMKFGTYMQTLAAPTSINLLRVQPLRSSALCVVDPKLVYTVVDGFFGGRGRLPSTVAGKAFTPTELRIVRLLLNQALGDLKDAWAPVMPVGFEYVRSEEDPHFANIAAPSEVVVVSRFQVSIEEAGGELHVIMPYSMVEAVRPPLEGGNGGGTDTDGSWPRMLQDQLKRAQVQITVRLCHATISLRELLRMKAGDIIPVDLPEQVTLLAEDVPILRGRYGAANGNVAVKVAERIRSPEHD